MAVIDKIETGRRIKNLRESQNMYQAELAKKVKVATESVIRWEAGKHAPSEKHIKELARVLQTSTDYLCCIDSVEDSRKIKVRGGLQNEVAIFRLYLKLPAEDKVFINRLVTHFYNDAISKH